MDEITPIPLDHEATVTFLYKKINDWHKRLNVLEIHVEAFSASCTRMDEKLSDIHTSMVGSVDGEKRGWFRRLELIESRGANMVKALWVVYVAVVTSVIVVIAKAFKL